MMQKQPEYPAYMPAAVLLASIMHAYVAGSGYQYPDAPWTLHLMPVAAGLFLFTFVLLLFRSAYATVLFLLGALLTLPYLLPSYFYLLVACTTGNKSAFFPLIALTVIALLTCVPLYYFLRQGRQM